MLFLRLLQKLTREAIEIKARSRLRSAHLYDELPGAATLCVYVSGILMAHKYSPIKPLGGIQPSRKCKK